MSVWKQSSTTNKILLGVLLLVFFAAFLLLILSITGNLPFGGSSAGEYVLVVPTPLPGEPLVITTTNIDVRSGPGTDYVSYGILGEGSSAAVSGVSPDGLWFVIVVPSLESGQGWVADELVEAVEVENVPIVDPPPLLDVLPVPTPLPETASLTTLAVINVRSGPGSDYESYGLLDREQTAAVNGVSSDGSWWVIDLPAGEPGQGWVSAGYISTENVEGVPVIEFEPEQPVAETPTPAEASLTATLNADIYSGPGTDFYVFGVLGEGETAEVSGVSPDGLWWLIQVDDLESGQGWVSAELVTTSNSQGVTVVEPEGEPSTETTPSPDSAMVTAIANVNIRSGPDTGFGKVGLMEFGQVALVLGVSPDRSWWLIRLPSPEGGQGWVSAQFVTPQNTGNVPVVSGEGEAVTGPVTIPAPAAGEPAVTAITNVNVRSGPGTSNQVIGLLGLGQKAGVVGKSSDGSWWVINIPEAENGRGWISANYVTPENIDDVPLVQ